MKIYKKATLIVLSLIYEKLDKLVLLKLIQQIIIKF